MDFQFKNKAYTTLLGLVEAKMLSAQQAIDSAIESRDNETKSSVGDKYETGRAMMQLEQQRNEVQLAKALKLKSDLKQITIDKSFEQVNPGALVICDDFIYFISIGLGKILVEDQKVYAISLDSPLGKKLQGKKVGEEVVIKEKKILIKQII